MKMSSGISNRLKVILLSSLFVLASGCSGDEKKPDEELDVSGEDAAMAAPEGDGGEAAAPAPGKKAKKGKKGKKVKKKKPTAKKAEK